MKLNIRRMQEGGALSSSAQAYGFLDYTPYIPQTAQTAGSGKTGVSSSTKEQSEGILSDDMIKALMGKGLTSDVNKFISEVNSMYSNPLETNPFGTSLSSSEIARKQFALVSRINQIQNGKAMFDKAVDTARESGALDEIAVTSFGKVVTFDNEAGGIKQVSPTELAKNSDRYVPLTNAELANLRMNNSNLAYDTNIFNILENAVGSKEVDEFIRKVINEAGKSSSEYNQFIPGSELKDVKKGLELLQQGIIEETVTDESNIAQLEAATRYLYRTLPENYKKFLAAKAAASGQDPVEGITSLIQDYASTKVSTTKKRKIDLPASLNKNIENSSNTVSTDIYEQIAAGQATSANARRDYTVNIGGNRHFTSYGAPFYNNLPDHQGKPLSSIVTLSTLLSDTKLSTIADKAGIMVGDQQTKPTDLSNIGIDTTQGYTAVLLPFKTNNEGRKVVDFDTLNKLNELNIPEGASSNEIVSILKDAGMEDYIGAFVNPNEQNTQDMYHKGKLAMFLVASGYASDNNFIDDNSAADMITDKNETLLIEQGINADREAHNLGEIDFTSGWATRFPFDVSVGNTNMYRTSIFIPFSPSAQEETLLAGGHVFSLKKNRMSDKVFGIKSSNGLNGGTNF